MMRVLLAGLFVFGAAFGVACLFMAWPNCPPWVSAVFFPVIVIVAYRLFNRPEHKLRSEFGFKTDTLAELKKRDLLTLTTYRAKRAFGVEEFEDEGSQYFIELEDGSVLFLVGQYLYDYEPITDDPEVNQPRTFPNIEFTIARHKVEGYVAEITCVGTVIEPEIIAPHFSKEDFKQGRVPADGDISTDRSYDEIKSELLRKRR